MLKYFLVTCVTSRIFSQSNDLELTIKRVTSDDGGKYVCDAINNYAGERRDVSITVISAPKVLIHPNKLNVVEGAEVSLQCLVESANNGGNELTWISENGRVLQKVRPALNISFD